MRGELVFRSTDFQHIVTKLIQRYGVDIEIAHNQYEKELFTGSFKDSSVFAVLKKLQIHYNFDYKTTSDDKILITFN